MPPRSIDRFRSVFVGGWMARVVSCSLIFYSAVFRAARSFDWNVMIHIYLCWVASAGDKLDLLCTFSDQKANVSLLSQ